MIGLVIVLPLTSRAQSIAQDLEQSGFTLSGRHVDASVMFCDIRGFTSIVESQSPDETIELLNTYYTLMFDAINEPGASLMRIPLPEFPIGRVPVKSVPIKLPWIIFPNEASPKTWIPSFTLPEMIRPVSL